MCTEYVPDLTRMTGLRMVRPVVFYPIAAMPLRSDSKTDICICLGAGMFLNTAGGCRKEGTNYPTCTAE